MDTSNVFNKSLELTHLTHETTNLLTASKRLEVTELLEAVGELEEFVASHFYINDINLRIRDERLQEYFQVLSLFAQLRTIYIDLSVNVKDFPATINSTLKNFPRLRLLSLRNYRMHRNFRLRLTGTEVGFAAARCLVLVKFINFDLDMSKFNELRYTLQIEKPNLELLSLYQENADLEPEVKNKRMPLVCPGKGEQTHDMDDAGESSHKGGIS